MSPFVFNDIFDDDDLPFCPDDDMPSGSLSGKVHEATFDLIKVSSDPEIIKVVPLSEKAKKLCEIHVGKLNRTTDNMSDIIRMDAALFESGNNFISVYKTLNVSLK